MTTCVFSEVFETSLTIWDSMNSFSVRFAILLTLCHTYCCTWPTVTKALATPNNSNVHVLPVGSKVMRCAQGIHCEYVHLRSMNMLNPHAPPSEKHAAIPLWTKWNFLIGLGYAVAKLCASPRNSSWFTISLIPRVWPGRDYLNKLYSWGFWEYSPKNQLP